MMNGRKIIFLTVFLGILYIINQRGAEAVPRTEHVDIHLTEVDDHFLIETHPDHENYFIHLVEKGDTLRLVSKMYRVNFWELAKLNGIDPGIVVPPGYKLMIPPEKL